MRKNHDVNGADERAVSPVIGVILMVAITVILAAVIGTFVLDLGQSTGEKTPQVSFGFQYDSSGNGNVTITHEGGDTFNSENTASLNVSITGGSTEGDWVSGKSASASAGSSFEVGNPGGDLDKGSPLSSGDIIRVIWQSPSGKTQIVGEFTIP